MTDPITQAAAVVATSPLAEASPASLDEYFSRNPLHMTEADDMVIVRELRRQREAWMKAEAAGAKSAPRAKASPKSSPTLADLGLED